MQRGIRFLSLSLLLPLVLVLLALPLAGQPPQPPSEPPAPMPSAAVQEKLAKVQKAIDTKQTEKALELADVAFTLAKDGKDVAGQAKAHRARAILLSLLMRNVEACAAWKACAQTWGL